MNEYISAFLFLFCFRVLATRTPLCLTALSRRGWAGVKFSLFLSPHHRGINILCPLSAALTNDMEKPISIFLGDVLLLTRRPILLDPGHNPAHNKYERNTKTIVNINTQAQYSGTSGSIQRIVLFGTQAIKSNKIGNSTQINPLMSLTSQCLLLNQVPSVQPQASIISTVRCSYNSCILRSIPSIPSYHPTYSFECSIPFNGDLKHSKMWSETF